MGKLDASERASVGQALNQAQKEVQEAHQQSKKHFLEHERTLQLSAEGIDLTETLRNPNHRGHLHLVTQTMERLEDVFVGMGFTVSEGAAG